MNFTERVVMKLKRLFGMNHAHWDGLGFTAGNGRTYRLDPVHGMGDAAVLNALKSGALVLNPIDQN